LRLAFVLVIEAILGLGDNSEKELWEIVKDVWSYFKSFIKVKKK